MTFATRTIKIQLAMRGWRYADLAQAAGLAVGTVKNVTCGANRSPVTRAKIEAALGGVRIWSTAESDPAGEAELVAAAPALPLAAPAAASSLVSKETVESLRPHAPGAGTAAASQDRPDPN